METTSTPVCRQQSCDDERSREGVFLSDCSFHEKWFKARREWFLKTLLVPTCSAPPILFVPQSLVKALIDKRRAGGEAWNGDTEVSHMRGYFVKRRLGYPDIAIR